MFSPQITVIFLLLLCLIFEGRKRQAVCLFSSSTSGVSFPLGYIPWREHQPNIPHFPSYPVRYTQDQRYKLNSYFISCYWAWEDILEVTQPFFLSTFTSLWFHFTSTFLSFHSGLTEVSFETPLERGTYWSCSDCTWVKYFCTLSTSIQQFDIW